jgi:tetratricopeptide (TPR) repeat protein
MLAILLMPRTVHADWCARLVGGASNCGYATHAQCLAAVSGVGGICMPGTDSTPTAKPRREPAKRKKQVIAPQPTAQERAIKPAATPAAPPASPPKPAAVAAPATSQPTADFARARQLILDGKYDAGIAAMRALKFDDHPDVAAFVGLAYRKLDRIDEARAWYERALTADPNHKLTLSFYGILRAETGETERARLDLEKIRRLCGDTACNEYQALASVIAARAR